MIVYLNILFFFLIFLFGITVGSFLNVCIYRIPQKESIVIHRSHCTRCGYQLKWFDLIPVLSYFILKGRCRQCGEKISFQYPLIEFANGILYVFIFAVRNFNWVSDNFINYNLVTIIFCFTVSALLVLSVIDYKIYEIPVGVNYFLVGLGFIRVGLDYRNWSNYLIGFFAVSTFLYIIYLITKGNAIGGGDIKLMAAGGLLLGFKNIWLSFLLGCILGSVIHLIRMKITNAGRVLALGPYLSMGMAIAILFGDKLWAWYLGAFMI